MKKYILNIFFILASQSLLGQVLSPMGIGLPYAPDKIYKHNNGLVVAFDDRNGQINVQTWNGHFWNKITSPNLQKTGITSDGEFKILDIISFNDEIYLAVGYENRETTSDKSYILKWEQGWTDISNDLVNKSLSIKQFFIENGVLKCLGKYIANKQTYNIIQYIDNGWSPEGNAIALKTYDNTFLSAVYYNQKLYATGKFTNPSSDNLSLVTWNGNIWEAANYPPFLGQNITIGQFKDEVVMYGESKFDESKFKISKNGVWQDISDGLLHMEIYEVRQFANLKNTLFALGQFTDTLNHQKYNLLLYDGIKWQPTKLNLSSVQQLYAWKESIILSGDFTDNGKLNYIGEVYTDRAQLNIRVFNDKNSDCIKDSDEPWMTNYPVKLDNFKNIFQTDYTGQLYLHVDNQTHHINAQKYQHFNPTCPDVIINTSEFKTYYGTALGVNQAVGISDGSIYLSDNQGINALVGDQKTINIAITNEGSQPISDAIVTIDLGPNLNLISSEIPYQSYTNNIITYTVNVSANDRLHFDIVCKVKGSENLIIRSELVLSENVTDQNMSNNQAILSFTEGETSDNYKYCLDGSKVNPTIDKLAYKIGIKNNSNFEVVGITLVDELDPSIIISKFGVETVTSHPEAKPRTTYEYTRNINGDYTAKLVTRWENILLKNSSEQENESKAFVDYTLNLLPNSLQIGQQICNTALIYFSYTDGLYEEPIVTNTACTDVEETLGVVNGIPNKKGPKLLTISPNPANGEIHISNSSKGTLSVQIVNSVGQKVKRTDILPNITEEINLNELPKGVYFVFCNNLFSEKFIIN